MNLLLKQALSPSVQTRSLKGMTFFFLPLGLSSLLVNLSHIMINATLARSPYPEVTIASYAVAMSLFGVFEKPVVLLRQTSSALVRDRLSFNAMAKVTAYTLSSILLLSLLIAHSPLSEWIFRHLFGETDSLAGKTAAVFQILMFVTFFSGLRCLFQGVIIYNRLTKWLTVGMVIRLAVMGFLALFFIATDRVQDGRVGAVIFLVGMAIESCVAVLEGSKLKKKMPHEAPGHPIHTTRPIVTFYRPLIFASCIAVFIMPSINAFLGGTEEAVTALASFAVALNVNNMMMSFFTYIHQIVLNFYRQQPVEVLRFTSIISLLPALLLSILCFTPAGPWFLSAVIGLSDGLLTQSVMTLRFFVLFALVFPWLDFGNGLLLLRSRTKVMSYSITANFTVALLTASTLAVAQPDWNGIIGSLALSLGMTAELGVVLALLHPRSRKVEKVASG